ncbi:alpha/beta-hydrolase [Pluteus cervinus]|uniref:Alpha/beta-hydrolase n=1 Tax=Pluteus cervinus TaxID=181527 RepID=A0ACD3B9S4_9AGAR|nr:alpha/beta-hydrolase [Pluteus cervinus]
MPYVYLESPDDFASIYYTTNTKYGNVGGFAPEKPTIIILHPLFLDSSWLHHQFGDTRLDDGFNMIAFDMRTCGQSTCRPSGLHDSWVDAADLARCIQMLRLPPAHILALEGVSTNCAERLAVLFPEMVLSLTLCNVPAPTELKWVFTAYDELMQSWCCAEDLESFEHVGMESVTFVVGPNVQECDVDLQDELIAYWEVTLPPAQRLRLVETLNVLMNRTPLKAETYASIKVPVLLIHGERNETCPKKYAELLQAQLTGVPGGVILYTVKGASGCLSIVPGSASIANQVFAKFLSRLPHTRSDLVTSEESVEERMQRALQELAVIVDKPKLAQRKAHSSLSFSCLSDDVIMSQSDSLSFYKKGLDSVFSPVGPDGRPTRRFSDRIKSHWFYGEKDGLSYAGSGSTNLVNTTESRTTEKSLPMPSSEPISAETAALRKSTFTPSSVDKLVIKGSMAKVVSGTSSMPFQRLLL